MAYLQVKAPDACNHEKEKGVPGVLWDKFCHLKIFL